MPKIIRSQVIKIEFNIPVVSLNTDGVTVTVHGAEQSVVLSGSGTNTLKYTVQRAIFRHEVTFEYDADLGDIVAVGTGLPVASIPEQVVNNLLPTFTVWDYNAVAPDADTDTLWDTDETRFDEVP